MDKVDSIVKSRMQHMNNKLKEMRKEIKALKKLVEHLINEQEKAGVET